MSNQANLRPVLMVALLGWFCWAIVLTQVSPSTTLSHLAFFALLYVALAGSLTLVAYSFSFRLFTAKTYRGNVPRSLQQGGLWAAFFVVAAAMQAMRALNLITAAVLLALFALAAAIVLSRR
jgi:hypothetical protein